METHPPPVRVLIASQNPELIMLVREGLQAWPDAVVCRVAASAHDAADHFTSHEPHIVCWDEALGFELPSEVAARSHVLMLGVDSCELRSSPTSQPSSPVANRYATALQQAIQREYELRRLLLQLRLVQASEAQSRLLLARVSDGLVPSDDGADPSAQPRPRAPEDRFRALGRLAAGVAHEVNNPLTFVLANLESLRESHHAFVRFMRELVVRSDREGPLDHLALQRAVEETNLNELMEDSAHMLTDCAKGMQRIQEIAQSLGTFARSNDASPAMVDLTRVVDDACAMVSNQVRYRARLVKKFEPVPLIAGHPGRLAQALVNLLLNAAEAITDGGYEQHRIVVSTKQRGDKVVISVSDTGAGIAESELDRIFSPGFTTKAHDGGMGLGLSLCRQVAEEHRGQVDVQPLPDRGTCFELIIPIDTGLVAPRERRESLPVSEAPVTRHRLLIVDDDAMVLSALRRRLRRRYDVVTVLGGEEGLTRLGEDANFDAIICDLMMPQIDGQAFYEAVVTQHPALAARTIFMSGGAFTPRLRRFTESVSSPVLQKPVTREQLEATLRGVADPDAVR